MKNASEDRDQEHPSDAPLEFFVPGLDEAAVDLRSAFPDLSEESLARVLGLPTRRRQSNHSVPIDRRPGGVS